MKTSYYTRFFSAYGTLWLAGLVIAIFAHSHINAGWFGVVGFPVIALIYAAAGQPVIPSEKTSFYAYFSSAWGVFCLAIFALGIFTQSYINPGNVGLVMLLIVALIYAFWRWDADARRINALPGGFGQSGSSHPGR